MYRVMRIILWMYACVAMSTSFETRGYLMFVVVVGVGAREERNMVEECKVQGAIGFFQ